MENYKISMWQWLYAKISGCAEVWHGKECGICGKKRKGNFFTWYRYGCEC